MKKAYLLSLSLAAVLLVAIGMARGLAKTAFRITADPGNATITSFTVAHPALRPGERTSVRVSIRDNAHGASTYAWKAGAGALSAADTNTVIWTAPESGGRCQVGVEVTDAAGGKSRGSVGILVSKYPADPLIMSVDPMGRKKKAKE
jgi:uncharacterized protein (DUF58 family)